MKQERIKSEEHGGFKGDEVVPEREVLRSMLLESVSEFNAWRLANRRVELDLRGLEIEGYDLSGALLFRTDLQASNLRGSKLKGANLMGSNLALCDLAFADMSDVHAELANFTGANLKGTSFREANLSLARLDSVDISETDMTGAVTGVYGEGWRDRLERDDTVAAG
jgi:uncharacterized protein YjbI with pentapeptide repeats